MSASPQPCILETLLTKVGPTSENAADMGTDHSEKKKVRAVGPSYIRMGCFGRTYELIGFTSLWIMKDLHVVVCHLWSYRVCVMMV